MMYIQNPIRWLTLVLLLTTAMCAAQEPERNVARPTYTYPSLDKKRLANVPVDKGNLWVRTHPLGLLDYFDWNITGGVEYGIGRHVSLLADVGYIAATLYGRSLEDDRQGLQPASGYLARTGIRWYVPKSSNTWYFEGLVAHKRVAYTLGPTWVEYGVVNGIPAFERFQTIQGKKEVYMLQLVTGVRERFGKNSNWHFEVWGGIGRRDRNYYADLPEGSRAVRPRGLRFFTGFDFGRGTTIDIPAGFRIVYQVK